MHQSLGLSGRSKLSSMHLISSLHAPSSSSSFLALKPAITFPQSTAHRQVVRVWADRREAKIAIPALILHRQTFPPPGEMFNTATMVRENLVSQWLTAPHRSTSTYPTCSSFSQEPWKQLSLWHALRFTTLARVSSQFSGQGRQLNLSRFSKLVTSWPQSCYSEGFYGNVLHTISCEIQYN